MMSSSSWFFLSLFVSTSLARPDVSIENSLAWASRKRPVPGLPRRDPKTAQIGPGLSGTRSPPEMIILLIGAQRGSGRLPNRRFRPLDPAPPGPPIRTSRRTLSKSFRLD